MQTKEEIAERRRAYRLKNKDKLDASKKEYNRTHIERCRGWVKKAVKKYYEKQKLICLEHYGGKPPKCACCGETRIEFLALDHIEGGGKKHHREIKQHSPIAYRRWLINNNFPIAMRVLCHNCNMSLGFYGYCPHNKEKETAEKPK